MKISQLIFSFLFVFGFVLLLGDSEVKLSGKDSGSDGKPDEFIKNANDIIRYVIKDTGVDHGGDGRKGNSKEKLKEDRLPRQVASKSKDNGKEIMGEDHGSDGRK